MPMPSLRASPKARAASPRRSATALRATGRTAVLKQALNDVAAAGRKSDAEVGALANGRANVVDVVTAVAEAETAVSALVAVRDSVIQSYQEVMRMTI